MASVPSVAMTFVVRNEAELIEQNLSYHIARGVTRYYVTDNGSADELISVLNQFKSQAQVTYRLCPEPFDQSRWTSAMAEQAYADGVDWVIHNDADEFWWPESPTLAEVLGAVQSDIEALAVTRSNFLPPKDVDLPFWESMLVRELRSRNSVGESLPAKVCHRAQSGLTVRPGVHRVQRAGETLETHRAGSAVQILHFPVRSYAQLERKVRRSAENYRLRANRRRRAGKSALKLSALLSAGRLYEYYDDLVRTQKQREEAVTAGDLVVDTRLRDYLLALSASR